MSKMRIAVMALIMGVIIALLGAVTMTNASAAVVTSKVKVNHTPDGGANCSGFRVTATGYEQGNTNTIESMFDQTEVKRNFATSDSITGTWPQDGMPHTWSGYVRTNNTNPAYSHVYGPITLTCGTPPPAKDASAALGKTPATCTTGETLTYGAIVFATWSGTADGTVGPAAYDTFANSIPKHLFGDGTGVQEFTGDLAGPNLALCDTPPPPTPPCTACTVPILPVQSPGVKNCSGTLAGGVWDGLDARTHRSCYAVNDHLNKMGFTNDAGAINLLLSNTDSAGPVTFYRWTGTATVSGNGNGQGCYEDPNEYSLSFLEGNDGGACHVNLCTGLTFAGNHGALYAKYITSLHGALRIFDNVKYDGQSTHKMAGAIRIKHSTFPKFKHGNNHHRKIIFTDVTIGSNHYAHKIWR